MAFRAEAQRESHDIALDHTMLAGADKLTEDEATNQKTHTYLQRLLVHGSASAESISETINALTQRGYHATVDTGENARIVLHIEHTQDVYERLR